jgi:hypothetical protein
MRACGELHGPDEGGGVAGNGHRPSHPPREHEHREPELVQNFVHRGRNVATSSMSGMVWQWPSSQSPTT